MGDLGFISGLGRSPGEGNIYPLQYSDLENSMDSIVHGGHKDSDMTENFASLHFNSSSRSWINTPKVGLLDHLVALFFKIFLETSILFSTYLKIS